MDKSIIVMFVGLIAHVHFPYWPEQNTAVLLQHHDHTATLTIPASASVRPVRPGDTWLDAFQQSGGGYVVKLDDLHVRLEGTHSSPIGKSPTYRRDVPNLSDIVPRCTKLDPAVRLRKPGSRFTAFFDYRGGNITVQSYLSDMLSFPGTVASTPRCVACNTRFETPLTGDEAMLVFTARGGATHSYWVSPATLEVANIPTQPATGHFARTYGILQGCTAVPAKIHPKACAMGPCIRILYPEGDCSMSQWP